MIGWYDDEKRFIPHAMIMWQRYICLMMKLCSAQNDIYNDEVW